MHENKNRAEIAETTQKGMKGDENISGLNCKYPGHNNDFIFLKKKQDQNLEWTSGRVVYWFVCLLSTCGNYWLEWQWKQLKLSIFIGQLETEDTMFC